MGDVTQSQPGVDTCMSEDTEPHKMTEYSEPLNCLNVKNNCNQNDSEACAIIIESSCRPNLETSTSKNLNGFPTNPLSAQQQNCPEEEDELNESQGQENQTYNGNQVSDCSELISPSPTPPPMQSSTSVGNTSDNDNTKILHSSSCETDMNKNSMSACSTNTNDGPFEDSLVCEKGRAEIKNHDGVSNQEDRGSSNKSSNLGIIDSVSKQFEKLCNKAFENQGKLLLLESKPQSSEIKERVMSYFTKISSNETSSSQDKDCTTENVLAEVPKENASVQSIVWDNDEQPESSNLLFHSNMEPVVSNAEAQPENIEPKDTVTHSNVHLLHTGQEAQGQIPHCMEEDKNRQEQQKEGLKVTARTLGESSSGCNILSTNVTFSSALNKKKQYYTYFGTEYKPPLPVFELRKMLQISGSRNCPNAEESVKPVFFAPNMTSASLAPNFCKAAMTASDFKTAPAQDSLNGAVNVPSSNQCNFNGFSSHTNPCKSTTASVGKNAVCCSSPATPSLSPPLPVPARSLTSNKSSTDMWFKLTPNPLQTTVSTSQVTKNPYGDSVFSAGGKCSANNISHYLFQSPNSYHMPGRGQLWAYSAPSDSASIFGNGSKKNANRSSKVVNSSSLGFGSSTTTTAAINSPVFSFQFKTDHLSSLSSPNSVQEQPNSDLYSFNGRKTTLPESTATIADAAWTYTAPAPATLSLFGSSACNVLETKNILKETSAFPAFQRRFTRTHRRNAKCTSGSAFPDTVGKNNSPQTTPKKANLQSPAKTTSAVPNSCKTGAAGQENGSRTMIQNAFKFELPGLLQSKSNTCVFSSFGAKPSAEQYSLFPSYSSSSLTTTAPALTFNQAQIPSKNENPAFAFALDHNVKPCTESIFPSSLFTAVNSMSDLPRGESLVPNVPFKFVYDTEFRQGVSGAVSTRIHSIVCMSEYEKFSQEELRLNYYATMHASGIPDSSSGISVFQDELKFTCSERKATSEPFMFSANHNTSVFECARRTKHKASGPRGALEQQRFENRCIREAGPGVQEVQTEEATAPGRQADLPEIWRVLECPVCLDVVLAPVYQCEQGHHVCNSCWPKVVTCPLCKRYKTGTRNYMAEALVEQVPLPCRYHIEGCHETVKHTSKLLHEERCMFRMYQCPAPLCNQAHSYDNMCRHFHKVHKAILHNKHNSICKGEKFCDIIYKDNLSSLIHVFDIREWGIFFLRQESASPAPGTALFLQVMPASSETSAYFYRLEICDHHDCRRECYKGRVFPMGKPAKEIVNQEEYLAVSQLLLKTVKKNTPLKIMISIWQLKPAFSFKKE